MARSTPARNSFPFELELELKEGHPRELFRLAHELSASVPLHLAARSKAERGYALIEDGEPNPVEKAGELNITATTSIDSFKAIAKDCLPQLLGNRPAMLGGNSEALHQMRIGLRRLRTAISLFKNIVAGSDRERIKTELKRITAELGPARDLDVLNTEVVRPIGVGFEGYATSPFALGLDGLGSRRLVSLGGVSGHP